MPLRRTWNARRILILAGIAQYGNGVVVVPAGYSRSGGHHCRIGISGVFDAVQRKRPTARRANPRPDDPMRAQARDLLTARRSTWLRPQPLTGARAACPPKCLQPAAKLLKPSVYKCSLQVVNEGRHFRREAAPALLSPLQRKRRASLSPVALLAKLSPEEVPVPTSPHRTPLELARSSP